VSQHEWIVSIESGTTNKKVMPLNFFAHFSLKAVPAFSN